MHWRGVKFKYHHGCIMPRHLDSYTGTIARLRNRQLEGEKKVMFLCRFLFIFHHELPVHGILKKQR